MNYFLNTYRLFKIGRMVFRANHENGSYHKKVQRVAAYLIADSRSLNDGTIDERTFKKVQWYMVSAVFLGELLAELTDQHLDEKNLRQFIALGAAGALADVLVDDFNYSEGQMREMLGKKEAKTHPAIENIFILNRDNLLNLLPDHRKKYILDRLNALFHWQAESHKQFSDSIAEEEVRAITFGKGGLSILLCAAIITEPDKEFEEALCQLGSLVQMMNDAQDLHKDAASGIKTFVSFQKEYDGIFEALENKRVRCFSALKSLAFSGKRKAFFLFSFYAMYVGILYKLKMYSRITNGRLDFSAIATQQKEAFRIDPFSFSSVLFCLPRIMRYNYKSCTDRIEITF